MGFLYKIDLCISTIGKHLKLSELNTFNLEKRLYLPHYRLDKVFKVTVVHEALFTLHGGGSLEITPTVPSHFQSFLITL